MSKSNRKRGRPAGYVMSDESKKKISNKLKGRSLSEIHKRKISEAMKGNNNRKVITDSECSNNDIDK